MEIFFALQVDCESTQRSVDDPALGERATRGCAEILEAHGLLGTFAAIPGDLEAHRSLYRDLAARGHEICLHLHPAELGGPEFLGALGYDEQTALLDEARERFADVIGERPRGFTPGYCSANDHTFPALAALGFAHGTVSMPTRDLPSCACVWGDSPLDLHYAHRHNRCLAGDLDFVDVPLTLDPQSRMWGGAHPQDLRIELVDAKNHWYTIEKAVRRQRASGAPVPYIKALTHNVFDYADPANFRRETLQGVLAAARRIATENGASLVPATTAGLAKRYRESVALPAAPPPMALDTRGRTKP